MASCYIWGEVTIIANSTRIAKELLRNSGRDDEDIRRLPIKKICGHDGVMELVDRRTDKLVDIVVEDYYRKYGESVIEPE